MRLFAIYLASILLHVAIFAFLSFSAINVGNSPITRYAMIGEWLQAPKKDSLARKTSQPAPPSQVRADTAPRDDTNPASSTADQNTQGTDSTSTQGATGTLAGNAETLSFNSAVKRHLRYPLTLRSRGIRGDVRVRVQIDSEGNTQNIEVLHSDSPELTTLVEEALRAGNPYAHEYANFTFVLPFSFTLR